MGNPRQSLKILRDSWRFMEILKALRSCKESWNQIDLGIFGDLWRSLQILEDPWRSLDILKDPQRSSEILGDPGDPRRSSEILGDPRKSSEILRDPRKPWKILRHHWRSFETKGDPRDEILRYVYSNNLRDPFSSVWVESHLASKDYSISTLVQYAWTP